VSPVATTEPSKAGSDPEIPPFLAKDPESPIPDIIGRIGRGIQGNSMKFGVFIRHAWPVLEPSTPMAENWHIDIIAEYLEAVHNGEIRNLIINIPPRFTKSLLVSVLFPCWEWTEDPSLRFMFTSYAQALCNKFSTDRRALILSPWYQANWGETVRFSKDQNLKSGYMNTARGHMVTAAARASAVGLGGKRLIVDDILNPKRAESKAERRSSLNWYKLNLPTRLDAKDGSKIIVEQRLNKNDLTGTMIKDEPGKWEHLVIPIEAGETRTYIFPISKREKIYEQGELLCPDRFDAKRIAELRTELTPNGAAAQLDQKPVQAEGVIIKREYWRSMPVRPPALFKLWVWDTAVKKGEGRSYSVGGLLYFFDRGVCLTKVVRERMVYPELKARIKDEFNSEASHAILVEDKSSGQQIIQELQSDGTLPIIPTEKQWTTLDKTTRCNIELPAIVAGRVFILDGQPWIISFKDECAEFPDGEYDDQVDMIVHGLHHYRTCFTTDSDGPDDDVDESEGDITDDL